MSSASSRSASPEEQPSSQARQKAALPSSSWLRWLVLSLSFRTQLTFALLVRLAAIYYSEWHDRHFLVKFTDVDYNVFTDAARHALDGSSPFDRHTYRYTPWLAWALTPNLTVSPHFGKLFFGVLDVFSGWLIYTTVLATLGASVRAGFSPHLGQETEYQACGAALVWLFNPLVFVVSARGSAEAAAVALVLLTLHLFQERVFLLSGLAYGLAVHLKIYPVIYAPALYLALNAKSEVTATTSSAFRQFLRKLLPGEAFLRFAAGAAFALVITTLPAYNHYGQRYLDEAILYHISRKAIRHNFSPYFLMLYLTVGEDDAGLALLAFVPQLILLAAFSVKFGSPRDLAFCCFCQTVVFVTMNKVVTSQYFLWYLALLPLCLYRLRLTKREAFICTMVWAMAQAFWLLFAYYLEFQGANTYRVIWMEGLAFFTANVGILAKLVRKYRESIATADAKCDISKVD